MVAKFIPDLNSDNLVYKKRCFVYFWLDRKYHRTIFSNTKAIIRDEF